MQILLRLQNNSFSFCINVHFVWFLSAVEQLNGFDVHGHQLQVLNNSCHDVLNICWSTVIDSVSVHYC